MIDFRNGTWVKLGAIDPRSLAGELQPLLVQGELWFSGLGKVRLEFKGSVNIRHISQLIGHHVL